jgi:ABC-type glycerol-3-phosphate transport system substrate-binding protein
MQKWIALSLVGLAVIGFVAERRLNVYDPYHGGKTKVRVLVASWQYSEFQTPDLDLERVVEAFEERRPDIDIDLRIMPEGNEITLMLPWQAGMTPFDLLLLINHMSIVQNVEGGFLTPLEKHLAPELAAGLLDEFVPGYLENCALIDPRVGEERLYGLPFMGEIHALNYRRDLLAERGLTESALPDDWRDFERLARELLDPEAKQYGMTLDLSNNFFAQNAYLPMLRALAGTAEDERGRLDLSSKEAAQTFRTIKKWYEQGLMPAGAMTPHQAADDFRAKIAVLLPNWQSRGFWAMRDMPEGEQRIGIGPCPGSREVGSLLAHYIGVIPKASPVPREAARFLVEAICFDLQPGIAKAGKMPTVKCIYDRHRPDASPAASDAAPREIQALRDLVDPAYQVPGWMLTLRPTLDLGYVVPDPIRWNRVRDIVAIEFQKYLSDDDIAAEEALARAERQIDRLYQ